MYLSDSLEDQLIHLDSWTLTVWILQNKVFFFIIKGPCYDFKLCNIGQKLYRQIVFWFWFIRIKEIWVRGLVYLNIKQCILILMKNYIIWSRNPVSSLLKKRTFFCKIMAVTVRVNESKRISYFWDYPYTDYRKRRWNGHASKRALYILTNRALVRGGGDLRGALTPWIHRNKLNKIKSRYSSFYCLKVEYLLEQC